MKKHIAITLAVIVCGVLVGWFGEPLLERWLY